MTNAAAESGVKFVFFKPSAPVPEKMLQRLPVSISVTGSYHQVGTFLAQVANLPRIVKPSNLTLAPNNESKDPSRTVKADFTATTFVFKEGGGGP
jgi:type IV pilus assembly protein PilO